MLSTGIARADRHSRHFKKVVHRILSENLVVRTTLEQQQCRGDVSIECLAQFHCNETEPLMKHGFLTLHPRQSKQWAKKGELAPKKAKTVLSEGKFPASVFWNVA
ncbi:hypothetical protein TNCV_3045511 [Trichonephila clavipes]|nr:hypothetical protein TNCV_3045511 [Trichonephila clavipes]